MTSARGRQLFYSYSSTGVADCASHRHECILRHLQRPSAKTEDSARGHAQALGLKFTIESDASDQSNFRSVNGENRRADQLGDHFGSFDIDFAWFCISDRIAAAQRQQHECNC